VLHHRRQVGTASLRLRSNAAQCRRGVEPQLVLFILKNEIMPEGVGETDLPRFSDGHFAND